MKRKYNKAIAALTLMIMLITLLMPMDAYAATPSMTFSSDTFEESPENDGMITTKITIDLKDATFKNPIDTKDWSYYTKGGIKSEFYGNLAINIKRLGPKKAEISITGTASNHSSGNNQKLVLQFNNVMVSNNTYIEKEFNIKFRDTKSEGNNQGPKQPGIPTEPEQPEQPEDPEQPEILTRDKIRVLEVYPNKISIPNNHRFYQDYNNYSNTEFRDIYTKWGNNASFEVNSISLNKFISLKEDVNGNYDIVYFGKGRYFRNAVDENRYGNDITELAANKIKDYIDAGQLCIFHSDAFRIDKIDSEDGVKSKMYEQLSSYRSKNNVIEITSDSMLSDVINKLNDSYYLKTKYNKQFNQRPILKVTAQPDTYADEDDILGSNKLTFKFKAYDPDTPLDGKLKVALYVDRNNDGLFNEKEIVGLMGSNETKYTTEILNGRSATLSFNMPQGLTGIFFWKLEVIDSKNAVDEKVDVFKLVNKEITVNVLQIVPHIPSSYGNLHLNTIDNDYIDGKLLGDTTANGGIKRNQKFKEYSYKPGEYKINVEEMTTKEFKDAAEAGILELNSKYDMIILGFNDNYTNTDVPFSDDKILTKQDLLDALDGINQSAAINLLKGFIDTKQSVMFTHDSIHFQHNDDLTYNFVDDVGQMILVDYDATNVKDIDKGVWTPGLISGGLNITTPMTSEYDSYLKDDYDLSIYRKNNPNSPATLVTPVNRNAIMLYPFNLENIPANQRSVSGTHYQWRKLNLEKPPEGEEEVIPLLNLYSSGNDRVNDDAMNNYYTYTKGNITYSGTGHSGNYPDYELKLFINTAIKAYSIANHAPEITVFEPLDNALVSNDKETFNLKFMLDDFDYEDENLKYKVEVDYDNTPSDPFVMVKDWTSTKRLAEQVVVIENKKTELGEFKVRITAKDDDNAESTKTIMLKKVDEPLITPTVEVYKGSNRITKALIGETVKAKLIYDVTGKATPSKTTNPKYSLSGDFKVKIAEEIFEENKNYVPPTAMEQITFSGTGPSKSQIIREHDIELKSDLAGQPTLKLTTDVAYSIGGTDVNQTAWETLELRKGEVKFRVKDIGGSAVEGAIVRDAVTNEYVGTTTTGGELTISGVHGEKSYKIDDTAAYICTEKKIYQSDEAWSTGANASKIDLNYDNYRYINEFVVTNNLNVTVDYYRVNADKNDMTFIGTSNDTISVVSHKNTPVTIIAKVQIDSLPTGELREVKFSISTKKNGTDITSGGMMAVISDGPDAFPHVAALSGLTQMKMENVSGSYAGQTYYLVINVAATDEQDIGLTNVYLKAFSPSGTPHESNNAYTGRIKFTSTTPPLLR